MGAIAFTVLIILAAVFTAVILIIAHALGYILNPFVTFLAVLLFLIWLMR